ncbi:MAG: zinc ribbon domain-containing protein [Thermoplasmata archaeon]
MHFGRLLTIVNFALLAAALVVYLTAPQFATLFLYLLIGWMFVSLVAFAVPMARHRSDLPPPPGWRTAGPLASSASAPLPSGAAGSAPAGGPPLGFCIYCAHDLPPGAGFCPGCGRPVRPLSPARPGR